MSIKRKRKFRHLTQKDRDKIDVLAREGYMEEKGTGYFFKVA